MNIVLTILLMAIIVIVLRNDPALVIFVLACYLIWKWFKRNNYWAKKQAEILQQDLKVKKGIYAVLRSLDSRMAELCDVFARRHESPEIATDRPIFAPQLGSETFSDDIL
jgi:hypothetical protein